MRKWRILSLALAAVALISISAEAIWVNAQGAPVRFEETYRSGSAADFAGLTIRSAYECGSLRWDTVYTPGAPEAETKKQYQYDSLFVRTNSEAPAFFNILPLWDGMEYPFGEGETDAAAQRLFDHAAAQAPKGKTEYTETLNAEDWFDEIPLLVQVQAEGWDAQAVSRAVKRAVHIPLEAHVPLSITVYRGMDGAVSHAVILALEETPYADAVSVVTQDAIWFAVNAPNGSALYRLTRSDMQVRQLLPETETARTTDLILTEDGTRLVQLGKRLGKSALRVLDAASGKILHELPLAIGEDVYWDTLRQGDHLLLRASDGSFFLLEAQADGSYALALAGSRTETALAEGAQGFVWDGDRLAAVSRSADNWLDLTVSVFFRDGRQSTLRARSSLSDENHADFRVISIVPKNGGQVEITDSGEPLAAS